MDDVCSVFRDGLRPGPDGCQKVIIQGCCCMMVLVTSDPTTAAPGCLCVLVSSALDRGGLNRKLAVSSRCEGIRKQPVAQVASKVCSSAP